MNQLQWTLKLLVGIVILVIAASCTQNWQNPSPFWIHMTKPEKEAAVSRLMDQARNTSDEDKRKKILRKVVVHYTELLHEHPDNYDYYINRGVAYNSLEQYTEAIADYTQVLQIEPDHRAGLNNRAIAYQSQGDLHAALADFVRYLEITADVPPESSPLTAARRAEVIIEVQNIRRQLDQTVDDDE